MNRYLKLILLLCCCNGSKGLASDYSSIDELNQLNLEQLMDIDISIADKQERKLQQTAAPVFVITADDIRHSGAKNIPEALRMSPGLQVSQIGPHDWSVAVRGFNGLLSNKLLVLVDGRTIYNAFNAGTYWRDILGIAMDDIEKIEIIRGPGGTIWGANAVNGVINIITRSSLADSGTKVIIGGGTELNAFGNLSHHVKISENSSLKAYLNGFVLDEAKNLAGQNNGDGGDGWRTGMRFDFADDIDQVMIDGSWHEHYLQYNSLMTLKSSPYSEIINTRTNYRKGHLLAKWHRRVDEGNQWSLQGFYDASKLNDAVLQQGVDVWDIDFNQQLKWFENHQLNWGAGYRHISDDLTGTLTYSVNPASRELDIYNLYFQNEIVFGSARDWRFTFGSKFEYYSLSKWEVEPSASLLWEINEQNTVWVSVSHAVRTPSRTQHDIQVLFYEELVAPNMPLMIQGRGKKGLDAENMTAYQVGWRVQFKPKVSADVALFYHDYNDLTKTEVTGAPFINNQNYLILPGQVNNLMYAQSYGAEIAIQWQATEWWRNFFTYSYFRMMTQAYPGHILFDPDTEERSAPQQQAGIRSEFAILPGLDLDFWLRYTDKTVTNKRTVNDFLNLDVHLGWRMNQQLEVHLTGQNLLADKHLEFDEGPLYPIASQVERGIYGKVSFKF